MTSYIYIAMTAYLLFAFNGVIDKILLTNVVRKPVAYVFFNGILSALVIVLIPFGVEWLGGKTLIIALLSGACFTTALYFYYTSIQQISISRVLPIQGGLVPLFTLLLATLIINEQLSNNQLLAFCFLTAGAVLISFKKTDGAWKLPAINFSLIAAFLFAMHFVLAKLVFDEIGFVSGLFWTRWGMFGLALLLLLFAKNRKSITEARKGSSNKHKALFYLSRGAGGLAGLLQNYAISLGSVTIVNALQSVQFTFVLIITSFLSLYFPQLLKEAITRSILVQKIFAIILVVIGLTLLTYS